MGKKHKEKVRLGGMALPNGVLVHGPNAWACAIRNEEGRIEVASAKKRFRATRVNSPFLRGPLRLAEALALLPQLKAKLPAAELPMENPRTVVSMLAAATFVRGLRESKLSPFVRELLSAVGSSLAALAPEHRRRQAQAVAQLGAIAAATELFGWMTRHPSHPLAQALSKPGHELQHRFSTAEPTAAQLEVAEAALAACLKLEHELAA